MSKQKVNGNVKNTADLRKLLIETIEDVRSGAIEPRQAQAISSLSGKILMSARLDLDAIRLNMQSDGQITAGSQVLQLVAPAAS